MPFMNKQAPFVLPRRKIIRIVLYVNACNGVIILLFKKSLSEKKI